MIQQSEKEIDAITENARKDEREMCIRIALAARCGSLAWDKACLAIAEALRSSK